MSEIHIAISQKELNNRKLRWDARAMFNKPDRIPVLLGIGTRFWLPMIGLSFQDYWSSPKIMLEAQLMAIKWIFENVREDRYGINVGPDFQNVREASGLGCGITFKNGFPWVSGPIIKTSMDVQRLANSDMSKQGLTGKMIDYYLKMKELSKHYKIVLKDSSLNVEVNPGIGTDGPFTNLSWLRGATQLLIDLIRCPELVHEMMEIVTNKIMEFNHVLREIAELPKDCGIGLADDFAAYLSPSQYREFVLPYHERMYESFGTRKRSMHLCGRIDHLLELLVYEEHINSLDGFGWVTSPLRLAKVLGGRVLLYGGPSPSLILQGPEDKVIEACRGYVELLAPLKGFALGDGYNIAPGTPLEHMNAIMRAAEMFGRYDVEK